MVYGKIDKVLFIFFQGMADFAKKIGIPLIVLINFFLVIQIGAQAAQIFYLYKAGESILSMILLAFPTLLIGFYFYRVISQSKKGPVDLDVIRVFAIIFSGIAVLDFIYKFTLKIFLNPGYFQESAFYFKSEIAYVTAYVAFPCFLYLLSCNDGKVVHEKMLNA